MAIESSISLLSFAILSFYSFDLVYSFSSKYQVASFLFSNYYCVISIMGQMELYVDLIEVFSFPF